MLIPQGSTKSDEVKGKRKVNSKHYLVSDIDNLKTYKMCSGSGHQHYYNKLGAGDGEAGWRELDWTLLWDDINKGWYFEFHSFRPFLPEYADDFVEFRDLYDGKDQTIKYKAQCSHILGRKVDSIAGLTDMNAVIYDDAFGEGKDYILYFTRTCLKKVVRIREGFYANAEQRFKFEIEFPNKTISRGADTDNIAYEFDTTLPKTFDTAKQTLIGNDTGDGKEWYTYMRAFNAWDSTRNIVINVDYTIENGKKYMEKIIPAAFLNTATGDVFTDTTNSYYAGVGDGYCNRASVDETWATIIAGNGNASIHTDSAPNWHCFFQGSSTTDQWIHLRRNFWPIDTSGIDDTETVTAATFKFYQNTSGQDGLSVGSNDGTKLVLVDGSQASTSSLANSDFEGVGSVDFGRSANYDGRTTDSYNNIVVNASGLAHINKTGFTKFATRLGYDIDSTAPTWSYDWTSRQVNFSETSGTSKDPYIEVTYSAVTFIPKIIIS